MGVLLCIKSLNDAGCISPLATPQPIVKPHSTGAFRANWVKLRKMEWSNSNWCVERKWTQLDDLIILAHISIIILLLHGLMLSAARETLIKCNVLHNYFMVFVLIFNWFNYSVKIYKSRSSHYCSLPEFSVLASLGWRVRLSTKA